MGLRVLEPGLYSLPVGRGRVGSRHWGVPVGGPADYSACALGNAIVGNEADALALEVSFLGPTLLAEHPVAGVVYGAPFQLSTSKGQSLEVGRTFNLAVGEILKIGGTATGCRAYLCVAGGFTGRVILGSDSALELVAKGEFLGCRSSWMRPRYAEVASWEVPGSVPDTPGALFRPNGTTDGSQGFQPLDQGRAGSWPQRGYLSSEVTPLGSQSLPREHQGLKPPATLGRPVGTKTPTGIPSAPEGFETLLRVVPGLQRDWFDVSPFSDQIYTVSEASDRMGLRLKGVPLIRPARELPSEPVAPGAVQITNDGLPVILGVDGQTIGGYPKIAHVIRADLDRLGQVRPGTPVRFVEVTYAEAELAQAEAVAALRMYLPFWRAGASAEFG